MEKKKKLQLNKETMAILNGESMAQVVGGANMECYNNNDCAMHKGMGCVDGLCVDLMTLTSLLAPTPAGAMCALIGLTYNHCPTAKTDCDSCMCASRWCMS